RPCGRARDFGEGSAAGAPSRTGFSSIVGCLSGGGRASLANCWLNIRRTSSVRTRRSEERRSSRGPRLVRPVDRRMAKDRAAGRLHGPAQERNEDRTRRAGGFWHARSRRPVTTDIPTLTSAQQRLVRDSFDSVREYSTALIKLFYGRLFEI